MCFRPNPPGVQGPSTRVHSREARQACAAAGMMHLAGTGTRTHEAEQSEAGGGPGRPCRAPRPAAAAPRPPGPLGGPLTLLAARGWPPSRARLQRQPGAHVHGPCGPMPPLGPAVLCRPSGVCTAFRAWQSRGARRLRQAVQRDPPAARTLGHTQDSRAGGQGAGGAQCGEGGGAGGRALPSPGPVSAALAGPARGLPARSAPARLCASAAPALLPLLPSLRFVSDLHLTDQKTW